MWINNGKRLLSFLGLSCKSRYIAPACKCGTAEEVGLNLTDVLKSKFANDVKCGALVNSGHTANVFEIEGWENSYVTRLEFGAKFSTEGLKMKKPSIFNPVVAKSSDGFVSVQKRINGEPLYGSGWYARAKDAAEPVEVFRKTYKDLEQLPDKAFEDYMLKVIELREKGYSIDTINPNNFLLDIKNKRINIIDVEKSRDYYKLVQIEDFYPFLNHNRLVKLMMNMNSEERAELQMQVKTFLDRMAGIAKKKGITLKIEDVRKDASQEDIVYIYHNVQEKINHRIKVLKDYFS